MASIDVVVLSSDSEEDLDGDLENSSFFSAREQANDTEVAVNVKEEHLEVSHNQAHTIQSAAHAFIAHAG